MAPFLFLYFGVERVLLTPTTILLQIDLALNLLLILTAPVINPFAVLTSQFY